jgi:hypothetical protein
LALHPFLLARQNAVEPSLSVFSPRIFHLQTIIMIYIVTACEEGSSHMGRYRSSIRVVDVNALQQQQRQSFDGNAFSSGASYSQRSRSSAIRLAL